MVVTVEELVVNTKLSPPYSYFKATLLTDYTTATASSSMTRSCLSFWRKRFFDGFEKEKVNGCSLVQGKTGCAGEKGLGFLCRWRGWCLLKKGFLLFTPNWKPRRFARSKRWQFTVCSWAGKRPTCRSIIWIYELGSCVLWKPFCGLELIPRPSVCLGLWACFKIAKLRHGVFFIIVANTC